jgi:hypothetical protein
MPAFKFKQRIFPAVLERGHKARGYGDVLFTDDLRFNERAKARDYVPAPPFRSHHPEKLRCEWYERSV